ncbi:MAG: histidine phosphatase family protein [Clostridia bacterium]|nr:histidine phosphatase family protein [Clostridia bacterium]
MSIYIVRHGQTDANKKGIFQGRMDIELNEEGRKQVQELANKLRGIKIDYILCSPLKRAMQTAEIISEINGIPVKINDKLIERSFGDMEGKKPTEDFNIDILTNLDINYDKHEIESIKDLLKRVNEIIKKIEKEYFDKDIILVTHAGVAQAILSYFEKDQKNILKYTLNNAEIRKINLIKENK